MEGRLDKNLSDLEANDKGLDNTIKDDQQLNVKLNQQKNTIEYYRKESVKRHKRTRKILYVMFLFQVVLIGGLLLLPTDNYFDNSRVEQKIATIINNGGDMDVIKFAFQKLKEHKYSHFQFLTQQKIEKINSSPNLSDLLQSLKSNYYENPVSSVVTERENIIYEIDKLNKIINEYQSTNPFDNLIDNQKYFFQNIRSKSDTSYFLIEDDVNKVADELEEKNNLVFDYLSKASASYRNSMIAMGISVISLIVVILLNLDKMKKIGKPSDELVA